MKYAKAQIKVKSDIPKRQLLKHFQQMSLVVENIKVHSQDCLPVWILKFMMCLCNSKIYPCLFQFTYLIIPQISVEPLFYAGNRSGHLEKAVNIHTWQPSSS